MTFDPPVQFAQVNGVRLAYFDVGAGLPVLMLHGWPQHSYAWRRLAKCLAPDIRIVAPDMRGCGDSEITEDGFDKRTLASDVVALCDHLELERVILFGHDWGAPIAYRFALDNTPRVMAIIISNGRMPLLPAHTELMFTPEQVRERWYNNFFLIPNLPEEMISKSLREFLLHFFRHWSAGQLIHSEADIAEYVRVHSRSDGLRGGLNFYRTAVGKDIDDWQSDVGRTLAMPNLVLWGARDPVLPPVYLNGFESVTPDLEVKVHEDAGHFLPEEAPDWCAHHVRQFLRQRFGLVEPTSKDK